MAIIRWTSITHLSFVKNKENPRQNSARTVSVKCLRIRRIGYLNVLFRSLLLFERSSKARSGIDTVIMLAVLAAVPKPYITGRFSHYGPVVFLKTKTKHRSTNLSLSCYQT